MQKGSADTDWPALVRYVNQWGCRIPQSKAEGIADAVHSAMPYLEPLSASALEFNDLRCSTLDVIEHAYDALASADGVGPTAASAILTALNPQLFVSWGKGIREAYFPNDKPNGATYSQFLTIMRMAALSVATDARSQHGIDDPAGRLSSELRNRAGVSAWPSSSTNTTGLPWSERWLTRRKARWQFSVASWVAGPPIVQKSNYPGVKMPTFSQRLGKLAPYPFVEISRIIAEKRAAGADVVTFGIGDPDIPTPQPIIDRLLTASQDPPNHRYPETDGLPEMRRAIAHWYKQRFDVDLDPDTEVLPLIGAKEGIGHAAFCFLEPRRHRAGARPGVPGCTRLGPCSPARRVT